MRSKQVMRNLEVWEDRVKIVTLIPILLVSLEEIRTTCMEIEAKVDLKEWLNL